MHPFPFFLFSYLILNVILLVSSASQYHPGKDELGSSSDNPYRHRVTLDPKGRYILEYLVDFQTERIFFNVTVATNGYVGLGISKKGKMAGADLIIGGVDKSGQPYFTDRHAIGNSLPVADQSQDWTLHEAWERGTLTFLSFSRPFDTCDSTEDIPITDDLTTLIWAYSERDDELEFHYENRGVYSVYLLDPDLTPAGLSNESLNATGTSVFSIQAARPLPQIDTLYWCSFHRAPTTQKQHIIGYNVTFPTERDRRMVHHLILYRCVGNQSSAEFQLLEQSEANGGGECYPGTPVGPPGAALCRELIYSFGVGGRALFFPDHVGIAMSVNGTEYFMLQVHYDNPNMVSNITINVTVNAYYTSDLRENDAGLLMIGATVPGTESLLIPPSSLHHVILGQCSPSCTNDLLPRDGINVFAAGMHTHKTGIGGTMHQYRDGREQPWILSDDNFNFDFQQVRVLRKERKIYPGDHMVQRCVFDTTTRNGSVVTGGFSTRNEMCLGTVYYYTRIPGTISCLSEIRADSYRNLIGIRNTTFDAEQRDTVITDPSRYAGMTVSEYTTNNIEWDIGFREEVQRQHIYQVHTSICPNTLAPQNNTGGRDTAEVRNINRNRSGGAGKNNWAKDERQLRRYSLNGATTRNVQPRNNAIVIQVSRRNFVSRRLNQNEVLFPKEILPYSPASQCKLDSSFLPKSFEFL